VGWRKTTMRYKWYVRYMQCAVGAVGYPSCEMQAAH
jgi:hypothetical protein